MKWTLWQCIQSIGQYYKLPLVTSMVSGATCGVIGCFVVLRRMALIGDALSHSVLPGVVIAFMLWGTNPLSMFVGAMVAGVFTSLSIAYLQKHSRMKEDSAVGLVFTVLFAIGVILISKLPRGTHFDLECFLFGEPLAIQSADAYMMITIGLLVCLAVFLFYRPLQISSFDPVMATTVGINVAVVHYLMMGLLSATVVASLVTVGVIMVVAMIIAPGITAYQLTDRLPLMLVLSAFLGAASAGAGFVLSFWQNWPVGPTMVVVAGGLFLVAMLASPRYGLIFTQWRRRSLRRHYMEEDILKYVVRHYPKSLTLSELSDYTGIELKAVKKLTRGLSRRDFVSLNPEGVTLTGSGKLLAEEILRAHRLWETYLNKEGMSPEHVHHVAEALEHVHEMADELDRTLGQPLLDPHGRKIPPSSREGDGEEDNSKESLEGAEKEGEGEEKNEVAKEKKSPD